jgi:hypothetical protein
VLDVFRPFRVRTLSHYYDDGCYNFRSTFRRKVGKARSFASFWGLDLVYLILDTDDQVCRLGTGLPRLYRFSWSSIELSSARE